MQRSTTVRFEILSLVGLIILIPLCFSNMAAGQNQSAPAASSKSADVAVKTTTASVAKSATVATSQIEAGKQAFGRFQCSQCHGSDLKGGVSNLNAQGGEVPALVHVAEDYTTDEIYTLIRNGRSSPLDKTAGPTPPIPYMPAWKQIVKDEYIHNLMTYILSKQEKASASW